ncbi:MAG: PLP-dependent aminotransferase family protein, partial [Acetatifactor sp.]|nr:PLP-dependent aminotransferase family protein [Acetatifactor sp.]
EDRYIIEDDYDSEFRMDGKPLPALFSEDRSGRVIYMNTFTKSLASTIRVGYMVLPQQLMERFAQKLGFYSCTVSRIDQSILNEFVRDGYLERHLNKMRKIYREKHDLLLDLLQPFEKTFRIRGENAGLHLVLESGELTEEELVERAKEKGVRVYGLSDYRIGDRRKSRSILLGFGALESEAIEEGIKRLAEAWNIE